MNRFPTFDERYVLSAWTRADVALLALDPAAPRASLRDRVGLKPTTLASRAARFLSMYSDYSERNGFRQRYFRDKLPSNVTPAWAHGTRQLQCKPFESGWNVLPGMERWARGARA